jgi:adenylosuccinate lyase
MFLPDHFGLLVYSLQRLNQTLKDLRINEERIEHNLKNSPGVFSSFLLHSLIEQNTCSRETVYKLVQNATFQSKTIEEVTSLIQIRAKESGLNAELESLTLDSLQEHYHLRFLEILSRFKAVSS